MKVRRVLCQGYRPTRSQQQSNDPEDPAPDTSTGSPRTNVKTASPDPARFSSSRVAIKIAGPRTSCTPGATFRRDEYCGGVARQPTGHQGVRKRAQEPQPSAPPRP